jgi:hypothetical protein
MRAMAPQPPSVSACVRALIHEATKAEPDWDSLTLNEAGDFVESVMQERHPDLTAEAIACIGNCYVYLMR